jgi:hypothetical protein
VTGQSFFSAEELKSNQDADYYAKTFCFDAGTRASIRARLGKASRSGLPTGLLKAYTTEFVLKTARNWKGPIGHFRLSLDKVDASNVLSLCWDGALKKTATTTFEFVRDNFAPKQDVRMLVLGEVP